jgi:hypothetical protein
MKARLKCEHPEDIEFTVTITMKAKEWKDFREQLTNVWPSSWLASRISDLLAQAQRIYWSESEQ